MNQSGVPIEPLFHETLEERIYGELVDLILDGAITPGEWVTVQSLAKGFGVSATPVREALKRLCAAKALQVVSGRSIGVPPLTLARLSDLRKVRLEIEGLATEWASGRTSAETFVALGTELNRMDAAVISEDAEAYLRANRAFHFAIYRACGSPTLLNMIEMLWLQISPYFHLLRQSGNYAFANVRHREAMAALEVSDGARARRAICADIEAAFKALSTRVA